MGEVHWRTALPVVRRPGEGICVQRRGIEDSAPATHQDGTREPVGHEGDGVGINCTLESAPVADLRRWVADRDYDLRVPPKYTLRLWKDWDRLGKLFAARRGPRVLRFLDEGGREVPDRDSGLDPPRVLWPAAVRELRAALRRMTHAELVRRVPLTKTGRRRSDPDLDPDELPILAGLVRELQAFIGRAAAAGHGLVVSYS